MDVLSEILRTVTVQGSLYFRTAFRPPWGVVVPRFSNVARFHLLTRGACWVRVENCSQPKRLESGDLIVIPHGSEHHLLDDLNTPPLAVDEVVRQAGFKGEGALVYGAESVAEPTSMVCGHFTFDADRGRLLLQSLPGLIHIPHTETLTYGWLDDAMKFIAYEAAADQPGAIAIVNRLSEIILIQTLRRFAIAYKPERGLFAALADKQLARAMHAFHLNPGEDWTVETLSRAAGMSRTLFSQRMSQILSMSPMEYVTHWRLESAHKALSDRHGSVPEIAESLGYQSVAAFSRAFKKQFGRGPGEVRRGRY